MELQTLTKPEAATGTALFAKGFRPFFLLAALHGAGSIPLWILVHLGVLSAGDYWLPTTWHAHEMVFGYATAVIAGFLLTAASNWTKRATATGPLLAFLCVVWIAGRIAPVMAGRVPAITIAIASLAFLPMLAVVLSRVIVGARSKRNYGVVGIVVALFAAQVVSHVGVLREDILLETMGAKLGVDLVIVLILVIGGRIIPLFTRNKTSAEGIRSHPWLDRTGIGSALALVIANALLVQGAAFAVIAGLAAILNLARAVHWGFRPALKVPLLWVLHIGYLFVPLGFAMRGVAALAPTVGSSAALHLLTAGAIGVLTLGMMARVTLGHTGRVLVAPKSIVFAFVLIVLAALTRVLGPLVGGAVSGPSLHVAATCWAFAFLLYLGALGAMLFKPRPDGRLG